MILIVGNFNYEFKQTKIQDFFQRGAKRIIQV